MAQHASTASARCYRSRDSDLTLRAHQAPAARGALLATDISQVSVHIAATIRPHHLWRLTSIAGLLTLAACGKDSTAPQARVIPQVREIEVVPTTASLKVGETLIMTARVKADSGADRTVNWSSSDPRRATVSETGIVTGVSEGTVVITASAKAQPDIAKSATLTVTPKPTAHALRVTPENVSLAVGETQQLSVTVTADEGVDRSVTFTSGNPAVAAVTATGLITAIAPGTAPIRVATVVDTTLFVAIGVSVRAPTPPQISIQSITQGTRQTPVNFANVTGQIDVTLNVQPGAEPLARVDLVMSQPGRPDTVVASHGYSTSRNVVSAAQRLAGAPNESWEEAAARALAALNAADQIVLSFRTDGYSPTTGAVAFRNGPSSLSAVVVTLGKAGSSEHRAAVSTAMTLNNADGFYVTLSNLTSTSRPSAVDSRGLGWVQAGAGLVVTSVPVLYSGRTLATRVISFPGGAPVASQVSTKIGIATDTVALGAYELDASSAAYVSGERPAISGNDITGQPLRVVGTSGDGSGIINAQPNADIGTPLSGIRVDNVGPPPGAAFQLTSVNGNTQNWIGSAYAFSSGLTGIVQDKGVGLTGAANPPTATSVNAQYRAIGGGLTDTLLVTVGADLPPSNVNTAYTVVARYGDRLGNTRTVPLSGNVDNPLQTLGVDVLPPLVRYLTAPLAGQALISKFTDSVYVALDQGGAPLVYGIEAIDDRAGLGNDPVYATLTHFGPPGTTTCIVGTLVNGPCTPNAVPFEATALDGYRVKTQIIDGGASVEGYYTYRAYVRDRAGNTSQTISKAVLYDQGTGASAPVVASITYPALMRGGQPVPFAPVASDNIELIRGQLYLRYPNLPGATQTLAYEGGSTGYFTIGTPFDNTLSTVIVGGPGFTVPLFIRALEVTSATHAPQAYTPLTVKPNGVNVVVRDVPNVQPATLAASVTIQPVAVESPNGATPGFANLTGINTLAHWRPFGAGFNPLRFEAVGPSGQTQSPFVRVLLARLSPGIGGSGQVWRVVQEVLSPTGFDNGIERIWQYDFGSQGSGSFIAIGVTSQGDAIATQVVTF